jgi:hypothetical protein
VSNESVVKWFVAKKINVQFTAEELKALTTMSENQFFRMRFLDPKMPGYKHNPEFFQAAQSAVGSLHEALKKDKGFEVKPTQLATRA